jgi:putative SOS response-associated peptidase YedK
MCGRYTQTADVKTLQTRFSLQSAPAELPPRYNLAPGQMAPVIAWKGGNRMGFFKWGLTPKWAKDPSIGNRMINARAETISEKPAYKKPFAAQRCLVPADGFYEWKKVGAKGKIPHRFTLKGGGVFAFAGLWDNSTFTIVTTTANELVKPVHDRMPVILPEGLEALWLDPKAAPDKLKALLAPLAPEAMEAIEVSSRVNSPKNDDPACAAPAGSDPAPDLAPGAGQMELF